jgi:acyl-CoA thioester hydrolase
MPLTITRKFRVRYYECDAYGHLNNANYLRFMQETAFDASAAAGYGYARYTGMGRSWLVRATDIEYLRPVRFNEVVEVKTWIEGYQRASSRRAYELRLEASGELVARAQTDWVFIDTTTGRPTHIPQELKLSFFPEGLPERFPAPEDFPSAPPPPPGVFKTRRHVAWRDIDTAQIVNNPVYLEYVEDCGMQVIAAHGWPVDRMTSQGFAIILRRNQIQYLQSARMGDELEIATWASNVKRSMATRHYTISRMNDGALLAQVHTLGVWIDLTTGRPIRIPPDFIREFAPNIVDDGILREGS